MTQREEELTEAQQQAQAALDKVMNYRFSNFDAGAVIHWAERGLYQVKTNHAPKPEATEGVSDDDLAYNMGLEIRYAVARSGIDPIQHIPEVDEIIKRRIAEIRNSAAEATEGGAHEKGIEAVAAKIRSPSTFPGEIATKVAIELVTAYLEATNAQPVGNEKEGSDAL